MKELPNGLAETAPSHLISLEALRKALSEPTKVMVNASSSSTTSPTAKVNGSSICQCLQSHLQYLCSGNAYTSDKQQPQQHMSGKNIAGIGNSDDNLSFNSEFGRMIYTISILLMFSLVILLLMIRSIKRSSTTMEVETLLDAMRFREELDIQQRQKRRLQKAKNKVTAWLTKTNGKMWTSSPQIVSRAKLEKPVVDHANRTNSLQSGGSYIPEIVISNSEESAGHQLALLGPAVKRNNSCTPSLSLLYDFGVDELMVGLPEIDSRKNSGATECSETIDLSQMSEFSFNSYSDLCLVPEEDEDTQHGQGLALAAAREQRSASVVVGNRWVGLKKPAFPAITGGSPTSIGPPRTFSFSARKNSVQLAIASPTYGQQNPHLLGRYNCQK